MHEEVLFCYESISARSISECQYSFVWNSSHWYGWEVNLWIQEQTVEDAPTNLSLHLSLFRYLHPCILNVFVHIHFRHYKAHISIYKLNAQCKMLHPGKRIQTQHNKGPFLVCIQTKLQAKFYSKEILGDRFWLLVRCLNSHWNGSAFRGSLGV